MAVKVSMPNKAWKGEVAGVEFYRGEAIFENEALGKHIAESLGYAVEEIVEEIVEEKPVKVKKEPKEPKIESAEDA